MPTPITIVVADDHPIFRKGLIETIQTDPELEILFEAADGPTALEQIEKLRPQVALLDVHMPKLSGLDVVRKLQKRGLDCGVIFLTMYDDEETFQEAMSLGVLGYILKESAVVDVLQGIKLAAEGRHFISPSISGYLLKRRTQTEIVENELPGISTLTQAERRILKMVSEDKTSKEIAAELGISPRTVETHRLHIGEKLNLRGAHSLLRFAIENRHKL